MSNISVRASAGGAEAVGFGGPPAGDEYVDILYFFAFVPASAPPHTSHIIELLRQELYLQLEMPQFSVMCFKDKLFQRE